MPPSGTRYTRLTLLLARVLVSAPDCWTVGVLPETELAAPC